jgi:hypothetical protein
LDVHQYLDGSKYEGHFKSGIRYGKGVMIYSDGSKDDGLYDNDDFNSSN